MWLLIFCSLILTIWSVRKHDRLLSLASLAACVMGIIDKILYPLWGGAGYILGIVENLFVVVLIALFVRMCKKEEE